MAKKAQGVVQSDASVKAFERIIANAYQRINETFAASTPTTRARRKKTLKQLDKIVAEAQLDMEAWANVNVAAFYEQGAYETIEDLAKEGAIFDNAVDYVSIHKEAIVAISEDMRGNIAQAMTGLTATGQKLVGNAARESIMADIATGRILGNTRRDISKYVRAELRKDGITALIDKGGRKWDLKRYSQMLARTKLTQAHNSGVRARMAEQGSDLAIVSVHAGSCPLCKPWEGEILSVNGRTQGYSTLDDAMGDGLFHPNCRHVVTPYFESFLEASKVWDAEQQKYVSWNEMQNGTTKATSKYTEVKMNKNRVVYRAVDSTNKDAVLGNGRYFAFDRDNVTRYGKNVQKFMLPEGTKMLRLEGYNAIDGFLDDAKKEHKDLWLSWVEKYGMEQANAKLVTYYGKKLGYDGIIGDDDVFGSVVFDSNLLKAAKTGLNVAKLNHDAALKKAGLQGIHEVHEALESGTVKDVEKALKSSKLSRAIRKSVERILKFY